MSSSNGYLNRASRKERRVVEEGESVKETGLKIVAKRGQGTRETLRGP